MLWDASQNPCSNARRPCPGIRGALGWPAFHPIYIACLCMNPATGEASQRHGLQLRLFYIRSRAEIERTDAKLMVTIRLDNTAHESCWAWHNRADCGKNVTFKRLMSNISPPPPSTPPQTHSPPPLGQPVTTLTPGHHWSSLSQLEQPASAEIVRQLGESHSPLSAPSASHSLDHGSRRSWLYKMGRKQDEV